MEDFPTLQGPRNSTMGLEVISPSVREGITTIIKDSAEYRNQGNTCQVHPNVLRGLIKQRA